MKTLLKIPALNRIEVRHFWEVAMFQQHGYRLKCYRDRFFMVRTVR